MSVEAVVKKAISELPEELWTSVEASLALSLAHAMDNQIGGAAASKEIDRLLTKLRDSQPEQSADAVDELERLRAERRGA
jgi:predicted component of type VI protein secretion system